MEETKIIMPENSGIDPGVMALMNNGGCNNMWNNPFLYLIWLSMFRGNGMWGNDGNYPNPQLRSIQDTLNSQATNGLVMDAIKSNAGSIGSLAAQMGCSTDQLSSALNNIQNTVTSMGYQSQLANCGQTNTIEKNFAQTNYNIAEQTCALRQNATDNADRVIAKLDAIEDSRKDREINTLTAQLAAATARAEREAELAPITKAISEIQAKQPSTATIPYPNLVGVPANQFYGYNTGVWG